MVGWRSEKIDDVDAEHTIADGRLTITADPDRDESRLYVLGRKRQPLGGGEAHVQLRITGSDADASVELDAEQADALRDALNHALTWEDDA